MARNEISETVAVCIVTYNSGKDLHACLQTVVAQDYRPLELVIVDCDSRDDSVALADAFDAGDVPKRVQALGANRGFAGGMNAAFASTSAPYLLTLNADVRLQPGYVRRLVAWGRGTNVQVGAVTGRLRRPPDASGTLRLDACGMYWTRQWRHLDRGSAHLDRGQFAVAERVVAGTGAATLWLRRALDDVALDGEYFIEAFHSYREDAELGLRLQGRGWQTVYEPSAVAEHRRSVGSGQRRGVAPAVNRNSLKNRYLLRIYHQTLGNFWRTLPWTLSRDVLALGWVLVAEWSSLGAYFWLLRHGPSHWRRRRRWRRRVTHGPAVEQWFRHRSQPLQSSESFPEKPSAGSS